MLLDEKEAAISGQLEEATIQKKKLISVLWIIIGILGFMAGVCLVVMETINHIPNTREKMILWYVAIGMMTIFGLLAFWGFKTRIGFNEIYDHELIHKMSKYEIYFWMMIFVHILVITFLVWDEF